MSAPAVDRIPVPTDPGELEDLLNDDKRVKDLFASPNGEFSEFIRNYAKATAAKDSSIESQIRDEVQRVTADFLRENSADSIRRVNLDPASAPTGARSAGYSHIAPGAQADALFEGRSHEEMWRNFLSATWYRNTTPAASATRGKLEAIQNAFSSNVPADGGFLIPETLRSELLRVSLETAIVRPRARVIPMESLRVPYPTVDATSNASNVYGGVTAYWTEESAELAESQAKFGRIVLEALKLTAYTEVPNELYTDSLISLGNFINTAFPEALAWFEDIAFMRGTGVGEPFGWMNAPAIVSVAKESGQAAATIVWENIVKMYARMFPASLNRAVWICHINTFPELATMALSVGTGGSAIWLTNGAVGPPATILGRPVIFTEKAETLGTLGDISFVDLGYYLIGDRQTMTAMSSEHYKFRNDRTAIRFIERVDGRPWLNSAITPNKGTDTLSPFVQLATRA